MLMLCLEWWTFEVVVIMAGLLPSPETSVSAMGVSFQITTLAYMLPAGISGAPRPMHACWCCVTWKHCLRGHDS
jgi:Na+-driven multidrug efflux pump